MTMPMSSRRSFISTAAVAAAASVSGCAITAPAAAAICRAAPYVPAIDARCLGAVAGAAAPSGDAKLLELFAKFRRLTKSDAEAWERYCAMPSGTPEAKALDDDLEARYAVWSATADSCYAMQPSTTAGALALLDVVLERDAANIDDIILAPILRVRAALAAVVQA